MCGVVVCVAIHTIKLNINDVILIEKNNQEKKCQILVTT